MIEAFDTRAHETALRIAEAELSMRARIGHCTLLAGALTMTVIVISLWATEPYLPLRTRVAFGVLTVIGASWSGYAIWVLTHRRVLFACHSVVAGWLALTFTSVFTIGAFAIGIAANARVGFASGALGLVLVAAATVLLVRARRRLASLLNRKSQLESLKGDAR